MPLQWPDPAHLMNLNDLLAVGGSLPSPLALWVWASHVCCSGGPGVLGHSTPPALWHLCHLSLLISSLLRQWCPAPALPSPRVPAAGAISIHVVGLLLSLSRLSGQTKEICPSKNENHLSQGSSSLVRVVSLPARGMTNGPRPSLCREKRAVWLRSGRLRWVQARVAWGLGTEPYAVGLRGIRAA